MTSICSRALAATLALCAALGAQRPSSWNALNVPGGVDPFAITQLGKLVTYRESGLVRVFSAFSRQWKSFPVSSSATLRHANDWLLIEDGNQFTAFSSMRGTFESITVSPSASVVNPPSQRNDSLLLVVDGTQLHAFSGLQGGWVSRPISISASLAVQRHVAIIADGRNLEGMSAFAGTWVPWVTSTPVSQVYADGTVGLAYNDTTVWGFSAQRGTWQSAPAPVPGASFAGRGDVAVWSDSSQLLGFSGLRGNFSTLLAPGPLTLRAEQQLVVADSGTEQYFFSAATGEWTAFATGGFPIILTSAAMVMLRESGAVHAYSALTGTVETLAITPSRTAVNWTLAAVTDQLGATQFYSAFTGQWYTAPPSPPFGTPNLAFQAGLIRTDAGYSAFSSRTGQFVPVVTASGATPHVDRSSGVVALQDSQSLHVFEPRRGIWLSQLLTGGTGPLIVQIWRTSLVAVQGQRAYGFGGQTGEIEAFNLPGPVSTYKASSESISLVSGSSLVAFGAVPDLNTHWQFPEFRRMFAPGSPLELQLHAPTGSVATMLLGLPAPATLTLTAGPFVLMPAPVIPVWAGPVLPEERVATRFQVPDAPRFSGLNLAFQGVVLEPGGGIWTTRMSALYIP